MNDFARTTISLLAAGLAALNACAAAADGNALAPLKPHPRLFADMEGFRAAKIWLNSSDAGQAGLKSLMREADSYLPKPVLERKMEGRRLLGVSREALSRIGKLAFAFRMTGERKYADRAIAEAKAVCAFPDWNPSHFLDVAEMTLAVALARDWLDDVLSPEDKKLLADAILTHGIVEKDGKTLRTGWWTTGRNNWNQVCHGGLSAGAAAIREDYPDIAEAVLVRARKMLPIAMKHYAGGNFPEGAGYWAYATDYNAIALDVLESQFADGVPELFAMDGFREQVDYMNAVTGPTGLFFNYSDPFATAAPPRRPVAANWYLAARFKRTDALVRHELPLLERGFGADRMMPFLLLWFRPSGKIQSRRSPLSCTVLGGSNPIAVLRAEEDPPEKSWYAGIKGGSPSASHGHMDGGSFVLDRDGVRWACDLGCEGYNRIEQMNTVELWNFSQNSSRWSLFRLSTEGHGTLQIDAERQKVSGCAKLSGDNPVVADLTPLYPSAKSVKRTFELKKTKSSGKGAQESRHAFAVRDELIGLRPGASVTWNMNTPQKVLSIDGNKIVLEAKEDAKSAVKRRLVLVASPADVAWEAESIEKPRIPADSPNPGISRIRFRRTAGNDGRLDFSVEARSMRIAEKGAAAGEATK